MHLRTLPPKLVPPSLLVLASKSGIPISQDRVWHPGHGSDPATVIFPIAASSDRCMHAGSFYVSCTITATFDIPD